METSESLASRGYWPAIAARFFAEGKYSAVVELCKEKLVEGCHLLSGYILYAKALYHAGQIQSAEEQFYDILVKDPDNIVALKYLGDIKFQNRDTYTSLAKYNQIFQIDPFCKGVRQSVRKVKKNITSTVTFVKKEEKQASPENDKNINSLREIPFYTETMGDLYLAQGHARLAAEVFKILKDRNDNPRLKEKLKEAESIIIEKGL